MNIWVEFETDGKIPQDDHLYGPESGSRRAGNAEQFDRGEVMCNSS